ncbi:hypothetical protein EHS13_07155 [Paenibacillus psychroresistens]|uniref:VOC family protein n=1 Tax=Paenibacillus psychroresistens TaxID=1778678 RepID=A0A6B8RET1_9BACL|nr:hypothetical protein [Paenibacillus psychroresistens]QGQ94680.1 hypothetical protein EHS13_07155 [Paenibacillus psychroresistens]
MSKPKLTSVDSIYIPVKKREHSMNWFLQHFDLIIEGDHLKIGHTELFCVETTDERTTNFATNAWQQEEKCYEMPAFCFRSDNLRQLHEDLKNENVRVTEITSYNWFEEFDFFDLDNNKFKVWKPSEARHGFMV